MNVYHGQCHCGELKVEFSTAWEPPDFQLTECGCRFCRLHGARTTRDPQGHLKLMGAPREYHFGLATAQFCLCPVCGVYVAAVLSESDACVATLNVNVLTIKDALTMKPQVGRYESETAAERVRRRLRSWTPCELLKKMGSR